MSSKDDQKAQAAADRIKAAALTAAKGLSRAQAERAATAAARNVNAYGQKEEGPSRWQERKEAKRQMYLMSTEKAVRLGVRKDAKGGGASSSAIATSSQCQKCLQSGHWTFECKNERVYTSRPSRSQQLKNPKLKMPLSGTSYELERDEAEKSVKQMKKKSKRKDSERDDSDASVFDTESESESESESEGSESSLSYSSSDSEERRRKKKKQKRKRSERKKKYSSSESESETESESESDSEDDSRKKGKRHGKRH